MAKQSTKQSSDISQETTFRTWLNRYLEETDTNLTRLAAKVGVRQSYLSMLRHGQRKRPSREVTEALAEAFGAPLDEALKAAGLPIRPRERGALRLPVRTRGGHRGLLSEESALVDWRRLLAGQLTSRELPEKLDLFDILDNMNRLWQLTAQDSKERGACIVLDEYDILRLVHEVVGELYGVQPMHRVGDSDDHLGFFQTHPLYPDGTEQVGFSDREFAGVLEDGDRLSVVRSVHQVFALIRTERTRPPGPVSAKEVDEFFAVFQSFKNQGLPPDEFQRQANYELCRRLKLAFYAGEFGQSLRREVLS